MWDPEGKTAGGWMSIASGTLDLVIIMRLLSETGAEALTPWIKPDNVIVRSYPRRRQLPPGPSGQIGARSTRTS